MVMALKVTLLVLAMPIGIAFAMLLAILLRSELLFTFPAITGISMVFEFVAWRLLFGRSGAAD